ncbi:MAG: AraC family transcriptional regulator [Firmicutes bacterium]|nr:AraC family transcriptional regulator [Bacillota bacterium]
MDIPSLKENARHGTVSFPLALYEWHGSNDWKVPLHWHDEIEFVYFEKGTFPAWVNTKELMIEAPAIMCIHPGELHSFLLPAYSVESAVVFNLNILSFEHYDAIQAKLIRPLMDGRLRMPLLIEHTNPVFSHIRGCYQDIAQKLQKMNVCSPENDIEKNSAYLQIKALLYDMLAALYANNCLIHLKDTGNENEHQIENLKKVLLYINENYSSPIRLDDLALLINLNAQYFCRYFKENIGKTVTEYINEIRIEKAAEALAETNDKIINIAQDTGFDNIGYFIRRFKKEKGLTPTEYRKRASSDQQEKVKIV